MSQDSISCLLGVERSQPWNPKVSHDNDAFFKPAGRAECAKHRDGCKRDYLLLEILFVTEGSREE